MEGKTRQVLIRGVDGRTFAVDLPSSLPAFEALKAFIAEKEGIPEDDQVIISSGKLVESNAQLHGLVFGSCDASPFPLALSLRLCGGKGGFGSLLRSQKAKKKTTNFGSSRTLDGRRVRDIEREQQAADAAGLRAQAEEEAKKKREDHWQQRELETQKKVNDLMAKRKELVEDVNNAVEMGLIVAREMKERERLEKEKKEKEKQKTKPRGFSMMPGFEDMSSSSGSQSGEDIDSADQDGEDEIEDEKGAMEKDEKGEKDGELDKESTISPAAPSGEKTTNSEQDQDTRGMKRTRDDNDDSPQLLDLVNFESASALEQIGLEELKVQLSLRGMKVGGSLTERAQRLFSIKGLALEDIPANLKAANPANPNKKLKRE